jgi:hypothetical protein
VPVAATSVPARLDLLSAAQTTALVLAYQTVLRDYLEPSERAAYESGMRDWIRSHPPGKAVWVELEAADGEDRSPTPGALVAHARAPWGDLLDLELARCTMHPLLLDVDRRAAEELRTLLGGRVEAGVRA